MWYIKIIWLLFIRNGVYREGNNKFSYLSPDQIYQVFYWIVLLRNRKYYRIADFLRKKLERLGNRKIGEEYWHARVRNNRLIFPDVQDFKNGKNYETLEMYFGEISYISGEILEYRRLKEKIIPTHRPVSIYQTI